MLWEQGFFGKGSLSRSEPTWLQTQSVRRGKADKQTSEVMTMRRREERRRMKNERAVKAQEAIEETKKLEITMGNGNPGVDHEAGKENRAPHEEESATMKITEASQKEPNETAEISTPMKERNPNRLANISSSHYALLNGNINNGNPEHRTIKSQGSRSAQRTVIANDLESQFLSRVEALKPTSDIPTQQEHLQLTPSEAFFLCYALGSLDVYPCSTTKSASTSTSSDLQSSKTLGPAQLLRLFLSSSNLFIPAPAIFRSAPIQPDDPFLLTYITYHHFRSLGWTPRPGLKFGCDFLLYPNGPAIEHAPFSVIILASYTQDPWWRSTEAQRKYVEEKERKRTWQWWHAVNRVQGQVKKGVVVCWVAVPGIESVEQCLGEGEGGEEVDVERLLRLYKVTEMVCRRWSPNRGRD